MIANRVTHISMFRLSYISGLNIIFTLYINIFKKGKIHHVLWASLLLLQITPANIYPVTSASNSFKSSRSLTTISTTVAWLKYLNFTYCIQKVFLEKVTGSQLVHKFLTFYGTRSFITTLTNPITCHYTEYRYMNAARNGGIFRLHKYVNTAWFSH